MSRVDHVLNFPKVSGTNLEGRRFNLPNDFEGTLNVVVVAFRREQTALIEGWADNLEKIEREYQGTRYYELPVLSRSYSPLRWWIDGGMRAGITDSRSRNRTITVYTTKNTFKNVLAIVNEETIHIYLIDKSGKVQWQTEGEFTMEKQQQLQLVIEKLNKQGEVM
jgi:hypothetical protein